MNRRTVPGRVHWAVGLLAPAPGARILEIGYGSGAAAEVICGLLDDGGLYTIVYSATAVSRTMERNHAWMEVGCLVVEQVALADLTATESYDLAFALNVNDFWTWPDDPEFPVLHQMLAPGGRLGVLYGRITERLATLVEAAERTGFTGIESVRGNRGCGVVAHRGSG